VLGLHLVHQLRRDRVDRDQPAGAGVLGDHAAAVGTDLRDRETERPVVAGQVEEAREVAAGCLCPALDHVAGNNGAGQLVVLLRRPAEPPDRRADHDGGVGHPTGHHDVSAGLEGPGDAETTEVGVGRQGSTKGELGGARRQVVTVDPCDPRREAESLGDLGELVDQTGRVEPAGVGHDPHALLESELQAVRHLPDEGARVAERGVLELVLAEDQHGQLGEVVARDDVCLSALEELAHGREPVAVEAAAVADAEHLHR